MNRVLVTGGSGTVGRFIVDDLLANGYDITIAGRSPPSPGLFSRPVHYVPFTLDPKSDFASLLASSDLLVHAAFSHVPGHYRGGEGDDVAGFWRSNFLSTLCLFQAAVTARLRRGIFLSSRAVYGAQPAGLVVDENSQCHPDTHYGAVKLACERHLAKLSADSALAVASLRATGVYGAAYPGCEHKWSDLFADYLAGKTIEPRCGTEVHGRDLARAVRLMLELPEQKIAAQSYNVSDIFLDRRDLLAMVQRQSGCTHPLPRAEDKTRYNIASTEKLETLGWCPGGRALLEAEIARLFARND